MNKNKGIIPIGLIIAVILGIVVVVGGVYYLGTREDKKVVDLPEYKYEVPTPPFLDESNYVPPTSNLKTYTNKEYGIEFKYSPSSVIKESELPNGMYPEGGYAINLSVPFVDKYDSWISKNIDIIITKSNCSNYLPNTTLGEKVINNISYLLQDPDWGATSGMSSISKWRKYYHESIDKCYMIEEVLRGLGNNERPSTATFPSDVDKFLELELMDLDKIIGSIKIN